MSTNYYLHPDPQTYDPFGLTDGLDERHAVHIGKFSGGWRWTWQGFTAAESPADGALVNDTSWRQYLEKATAEGFRIITENGVEMTVGELFVDVEEARRNARPRQLDPVWGIERVGFDLVSYGEWC